MPGISSSDVVQPHRLSPTERRAFGDQLYAVHDRVFDGVDREEFQRYVVDSSAAHTWIEVFRNEAREAVGYFALHIFEKELEGKTTAVFRAEAGMLRRYRGGGSPMSFAVRRILTYAARHPGRRMFYLGCLVHPSSYTMLARYADLWPRHGEETPPEIVAFLDALGDEFHLERVRPDNPLVRRVGWKTRDTEIERGYWLGCAKPSAQHFLRENPGYVDGDGLLTLVPLTPAAVVRGLARIAEAKNRGRLDAVRDRLGGKGRSLDREGIVRALQGASLFRPLGDWDLEHLAAVVEVVRAPGGSHVIRQGEAGDAMYVIVEGVAYVSVPGEQPDDDEQLLDELGPGESFGEIALLTGAPRSASVRAVNAMTLLKIGRAPFHKLLAARRDLHDGVWDAFVRHRLRSAILGVRRFAALDLATRMEWINAGRRVDLASGASEQLDESGWVFVAAGSVEIARGDHWVAASAPILLGADGATRLTATSSAVLSLLPPPPSPPSSPASSLTTLA